MICDICKEKMEKFEGYIYKDGDKIYTICEICADIIYNEERIRKIAK